MTPKITKLANGLTVITDAMPHLETASLGVWVDAGARNETQATNGIAHMLEHMAFKGTRRRSARGIAEEVERVGGFINAYTGREQTAYYIRMLKDDVPLGVDILADILQDSVFDDEELAREKGVVIQEIGQTQDTPDDLIFDHLQATAYPDQSLGRPILGTEQHVRSFTRETLFNQIKGHYFAGSMLLMSAGAVNHDQMVTLAEKHFGNLPSGVAPTAPNAKYAGGEFRDDDDLEQAHLALAFQGFRADDEDIYAYQVYSTVLGGGMSSRLFQEAREKRGLCYSIHTFGQSFRETGMFGVYAGTSAADAEDLTKVIADEMKSLAASAGEDEVVRARAQIKSGLLMGLEQSFSRCEQMAGQMFIYGRLIDAHELIAKIDAIDTKAVSRIGQKILANGQLSLAALGPVGSLGSYDRVAKRFA
ncbi:MAG: insulinase family protein [Alphaproteobacteria bacterium]|nr:insulinase family protein [Alphaproteobacteria bacterium]